MKEPDNKQPPQKDNSKNKEKPIPFFGQSSSKKKKNKNGYQFGFFSFLSTIALCLLILTFTPAYSIIISILPESARNLMLSRLYQNVVLNEETIKLDKPFKIKPETPLPILDFDTGVCFTFHSTKKFEDKNFIDTERLNGAAHGKKIAEIIAIGTKDKYEYKLEKMSVNEILDKDDRAISVICQKFGNRYGSTPETISTLYIRPLKPFTAHQIIWSSTKHLYIE